ncbi:UNVERIFIED_CONTAM: putative galactinol--sucrose galactosyltransferase 2 [Sesamum angustifolium]|uniref:galactinol--sucrose galactosyltransferase n=1 Tax=Sesamum angustifolium TaxID=2727405 RepID=A0AAW2MSG8_9LAMI
MTVTPKISVNDGNLVVHGKTILSGVHDNIVLTPGSGVGLVAGAFIGATASHSKSLHVFPVGVLEAVEKHLQTFQHREKKKLPSFIDWFGWCTWDAFYTDVTAEGVEEGLKSLSEGGTPPRFLIIDDGWQQIGSEVKEDPNCVVQEGAHDKPGNHNFELLKKLVLPDGSILRAKLPGRPTVDCLFVDPARDGTSLLKIWNVNKCSGVVGVFNCQGAGWCKVAKKTRIHDASPGTLTGSVQATDVDTISQIAGPDWTGDAIVYAHRSREVVRLPKGVSLPVTLKVLEYELFHFCPVKNVTETISFASIGLLDMFNSTGAVEQLEIQKNQECLDSNSGSEASSGDRIPVATVTLKVRGCGRFGVYCSQRPLKCTVDNTESEFNYDDATGLVTLTIPEPVGEMYKWSIEIQV